MNVERFSAFKIRNRIRADEENSALIRGMIMTKLRLFFSPVIVALVCCGPSPAQQTRITWQDYLGGPDSSHYSALQQINTSNVNKLDVAWSYPTGDDTAYTFSPLVVDNMAYFAAQKGSLVAVDERQATHCGSIPLRPPAV